jgi:hypothetical protein
MAEMPSTCRELLSQSLQSGRLLIGEILLGKDYSLRHAGDECVKDLEVFTSATDAREIARYDGEGNFRSLKTAPNLKRGWLLQTTSLDEMEQALEYFYPAAIGLWLSYLKGLLIVTSLRQTLDRQTGMYRITQLLKTDQAGELVAQCCNSEGGCLRTILWDLEPGQPIDTFPASKLSLERLPNDRIPLICRELCNLVVAAARPIARGNLPKKD